jgi:hypothetical protein
MSPLMTEDLLSRIKEAAEKASMGSWFADDGSNPNFFALASPRNILALIGEVERLREALEDVVNPMRVLERQAEADGAQLNGAAYTIASSLGFVQSIARQSLQGTGEANPNPQQGKTL